jgi:hypothetical protein
MLRFRAPAGGRSEPAQYPVPARRRILSDARMTGLIERAGFRIDRKDRWDAIYADYTCTKIANCSVT